jgi:hypothetical protein
MGRPSLPCLMASTLHRICWLSNLQLCQDNAPEGCPCSSKDSKRNEIMPGIVSPMNDIAIQVGGAKAGRRLSRKMTTNSTTWSLVMSANSATASIVRRWRSRKSHGSLRHTHGQKCPRASLPCSRSVTSLAARATRSGSGSKRTPRSFSDVVDNRFAQRMRQSYQSRGATSSRNSTI